MDQKERIRKITDEIDSTLALGSKIKKDYAQIRNGYAGKK